MEPGKPPNDDPATDDDIRDAIELAKKDELVDAYGSRIAPENVVQAVTAGRGLKKGTPGL